MLMILICVYSSSVINLWMRSSFTFSFSSSGISLCIVGASGSGKTALCAKLADSLYQWQQTLPATAEDAEALRNRPVKIVFCGTSSESFNALNMLRSVCRHISLVLDKRMQDCADILKMNYDTVVKHFHGLVRDYPVVVFFDSLDQLSNAHLARSDVSFLKGIRPHHLDSVTHHRVHPA